MNGHTVAVIQSFLGEEGINVRRSQIIADATKQRRLSKKLNKTMELFEQFKSAEGSAFCHVDCVRRKAAQLRKQLKACGIEISKESKHDCDIEKAVKRLNGLCAIEKLNALETAIRSISAPLNAVTEEKYFRKELGNIVSSVDPKVAQKVIGIAGRRDSLDLKNERAKLKGAKKFAREYADNIPWNKSLLYEQLGAGDIKITAEIEKTINNADSLSRDNPHVSSGRANANTPPFN